MPQDSANPVLGADNLASLGDAFHEHEPRVTTKESREARRAAPQQRAAQQAAPARNDNAASTTTQADSHSDTGELSEEDQAYQELLARVGPGEDDGDDSDEDANDADNTGDENDQQHLDDAGDETFELKVNGETKKLTRAEMIEAASKGFSAHERWERASTLNKHAEAAIQQTNQHRAQLGHMLGVFQQQLGAMIQNETPANLDQLAVTDPVQYVQQKALLERRQKAFQDVEQARQALVKQHQDAQAARMQGFLAEQKDAVLQTIPEWRDAEKAQKGVAKIATYLAEQGFSNDEISGIADARIVRVLHTALANIEKAKKYDDLMARARTAEKRVKNLPPVVEKPGARQPASNAKAEQRKRNVKAWEKNPNVANLAKLM